MVNIDSYSEILLEMQQRNGLDWEKMSREDRVRFKAIVIQFKQYYDDLLRSIEDWESVYGSVMEVGNYDMLLQ